MGSAPPPWRTVALLVAATGYGLWLLVNKGRLEWPPRALLASCETLAGALALVGPILLLRRESSEPGALGERLWLSGGLLIWVFDLAALLRGEAHALSWATPLGVQRMGLTILAVLLAGWGSVGSGRNWSWTNITGWLLGLFWVGSGLATLVPPGLLPALALR